MKNRNTKSLLLLSVFVALIFAVNLVTGCSKDGDNNDCQAKFQQGFTKALFLFNPNNPNYFG
jgi:hypothetical protein